MGLRGALAGFCGVVAETAKVLYINQKAMALFTILTPTIFSLFYLPCLLVNKQTRESLNSLELIYFMAILASWSLLASATVVASAVAHSGGCKNLPLHKLLLRTLTTCKIPLSTAAFATLFCSLYFGPMFANGSPLVLALHLLFNKKRGAMPSDAASVTLAVLVVLACSYVSFCLIMGLVVSVVEEKSGLKEIKKGRDLMKGMEMEVQGFVLNLVLSLVGLMVCAGVRMIDNKRVYEPEAIRVATGLIMLSCFGVVGLFGVVAYTILYIKCKKIHGQEIQVLKSMDCGEQATQPLLSDSA